MQFRIPQFLDVEDKVFGPFTFKQFGYIIGAIAFTYVFWKIIPIKIISVPFILLFSGTFLALAFAKVNDRPFADVLESAYKFIIKDKTYVWYKKPNSNQEDIKKLRNIVVRKEESNNTKSISLEKLKELSGKLDILKK